MKRNEELKKKRKKERKKERKKKNRPSVGTRPGRLAVEHPQFVVDGIGRRHGVLVLLLRRQVAQHSIDRRNLSIKQKKKPTRFNRLAQWRRHWPIGEVVTNHHPDDLILFRF